MLTSPPCDSHRTMRRDPTHRYCTNERQRSDLGRRAWASWMSSSCLVVLERVAAACMTGTIDSDRRNRPHKRLQHPRSGHNCGTPTRGHRNPRAETPSPCTPRCRARKRPCRGKAAWALNLPSLSRAACRPHWRHSSPSCHHKRSATHQNDRSRQTSPG